MPCISTFFGSGLIFYAGALMVLLREPGGTSLAPPELMRLLVGTMLGIVLLLVLPA